MPHLTYDVTLLPASCRNYVNMPTGADFSSHTLPNNIVRHIYNFLLQTPLDTAACVFHVIRFRSDPTSSFFLSSVLGTMHFFVFHYLTQTRLFIEIVGLCFWAGVRSRSRIGIGVGVVRRRGNKQGVGVGVRVDPTVSAPTLERFV